jgi:hypothetical protein
MMWGRQEEPQHAYTPTVGNWGWRRGDVLGAHAGAEQWDGGGQSHMRQRWSIASASENHEHAKRPAFMECREACGRRWVERVLQNFDASTRSVNRWSRFNRLSYRLSGLSEEPRRFDLFETLSRRVAIKWPSNHLSGRFFEHGFWHGIPKIYVTTYPVIVIHKLVVNSCTRMG